MDTRIIQTVIIEKGQVAERRVSPIYPTLCHCGTSFQLTCPDCTSNSIREGGKPCYGRPATEEEAARFGFVVLRRLEDDSKETTH